MALVVVPAKPLSRAKLRLAPVLSPEERRFLCLAMLADVCAAAAEAECGRVMVIASDTDAEAVARVFGATVVKDPTPEAGLNTSLDAAIPADPGGVLIVASDLPACSAAELRSVAGFEGVRIATDAGGTGTNALWRRPPGVIAPAFGDDSARRHRKAAAEAGAAFEAVAPAGLSFDVDLPTDLFLAWDAPVGPNTRSALRELGFPDRIITT
ncbi:MAG TPA: 2-phospho-L-lactate guanylyltransferase [Actinomycetota bacterium]|nr:2-phospho-L-lactate guanylyltransferase [Actinomycetota bacterium]